MMANKKNTFDALTLLRFIAAFLIINSHSNILYPASLTSLATGGAIGNSLFFFCSGFVLFLNIKNRDTQFFKWIFKRVIRIYPSVWVFLLCTMFLGYSYHPIDFIVTPYWFVNAIIIFYIVFYFIIKYTHSIKQLWLAGFFFTILFLFTFFFLNDWKGVYIIDDTVNKTFLHWYYYFIIMLFGALCAQCPQKRNVNWCGLKLLIIYVLYYVIKGVALHHVHTNVMLIQLLLPIILIVICYYFLALANWAYTKIGKSVQAPISYIANLTLDTYIVQFVVIEKIAALVLPFPLGLAVSFILILIVAAVIYELTRYIRNGMFKIIHI